MSIADNITQIRRQVPNCVQLVCVSKFHPTEDIQTAYDLGERLFGESRAQELIQKQELLPKDIEWHFIGSLQTNKVKQVVPLATLIHSVDSIKLLEAIHKYASNQQIISRVLLEVHVAEEETKHGFSPDEIRAFFVSESWKEYPAIQFCGLMTMGTNDVSENQTHQEFKVVRELFQEVQAQVNNSSFKELSMGMSHDFKIAIEEGSTIVRIGSSIFGERSY